MDDEAARLGPDLVGWLRAERVTVFCPPPTPVAQRPVATIRTPRCPTSNSSTSAAKPCRSDVADRWAAGTDARQRLRPHRVLRRRVRGVIRPGEPVTIGRPVAGIRPGYLDERSGGSRRRRNGRALHRRRRSGARLPERPRELTAREVPGTSAARAHLPHRRPGAPRRRGQLLLPRPHRCAGQDPRLPHRAGRDRSAARGVRRRA